MSVSWLRSLGHLFVRAESPLIKHLKIASLSFLFTPSIFASSWKQQLTFAEACTSGHEISLSFVGDLLLHTPLQVQATQHPHRFQSLWPQMIPLFKSVDIAYANLEGPVAPGVSKSGQAVQDPGFRYDDRVYSSYPMFNYHPYLVWDLKESGIDIVSTANNHSLDRHALGADRTIQILEHYGLPFVGTRSRENLSRPWWTFTRSGNFNIAWIACTYSTNGIRDPHKQVLMCFEQRQEILDMIRTLSNDSNVDAVVVTPHWGREYQHQPSNAEIQLGRAMIAAGATAVMATHPHVIQPWEKVSIGDREGLIAYSSGNFVSGQIGTARRASMMYALQLVQSPRSRKLSIKSARYLPLSMETRGGFRVEPVWDDSRVSSEASRIWNGMYHSANRITNANQLFVNECQR